MEAIAVINRESGSIKALDLEVFQEHLKSAFRENGYSLTIQIASGQNLPALIEKACSSVDYELIIACGGDGTASLAAGLCFKHNKIFGLLPGGTMNLYARTLGLPLDLFEAANALASSDIIACDISTANDIPFVHQFSIGIQTAIIAARDQMEHAGQTGKVLSGLKATVSVLAQDLKSYPVIIDANHSSKITEVMLLTVSNNPYGKNQLPFADRPDRGLMGVYWTDPLSKYDASMLVVDILSGNWNHNSQLSHVKSEDITLKFEATDKIVASLDGEIFHLSNLVNLKIHKGALQALVPKLSGK